jgi:hypothetical protein
MQQSRNEFIRRQNQQRIEADEKISFLLQQLRAIEATKRVSDVNNCGAYNLSLLLHPNKVFEETEKFSNCNDTKNSNEENFKRDNRLCGKTSQAIKISDSILAEQFRNSLSSTLYNETLRRWQAEKHRREQLEMINGEMAGELRMTRLKLREYI